MITHGDLYFKCICVIWWNIYVFIYICGCVCVRTNTLPYLLWYAIFIDCMIQVCERNWLWESILPEIGTIAWNCVLYGLACHEIWGWVSFYLHYMGSGKNEWTHEFSNYLTWTFRKMEHHFQVHKNGMGMWLNLYMGFNKKT